MLAVLETAANVSTVDLRRCRRIEGEPAFAVQGPDLEWYRVEVQMVQPPRQRPPRRTKGSMAPGNEEE